MITTATVLGIVLSVCLALSRLVPLTEPLWSRIQRPALRLIPPLVVLAAGYVAGVIASPATWLDQAGPVVATAVALLAPGANATEVKRMVRGLSVGAKIGLLFMVTALLGSAITGCAKVGVGVQSPCAGLYCLTVSYVGIPGDALLCYDSAAKAEAVKARFVRDRGCLVVGDSVQCGGLP